MREIRRSALVPATTRRMFELINDVAAYPGFVPGCSAATVLERTPAMLRARLTVGSGLLRTSFVTRNRLTPDSCIHMELEEGPLRSLDGVWQLTPVTQPGSDVEMGCRVELHLRFELAGGLTGMAMGPLIERMAGSLVDAFVARARQERADLQGS
ncbi:MAG: type II toxin-antitoxin system RatA family toxin [Steroidobacteraceae bacterium]